MLIFDIEKFATQDGPGIRSVVFMKGCPLHCLWCHNPESRSFEKELFFSQKACTSCGKCVSICPNGCHRILSGEHRFDREKCSSCGKCVENCYADALELCGTEMSLEEVFAEVMKDAPFYRNSGGGVTLSGGEPLAHGAFAAALLQKLKEAGIHTAVETSGFVPQETIEKVFPFVDLWLWDVKALPEQYPEWTGGNWKVIAENLGSVSAKGGAICLRCPLIPGVNDTLENLRFIAETANGTPGVNEIDLEPYHPFGEEKDRKLGKTPSFTAEMFTEEAMEKIANDLRSLTRIPVRIFHV